MIALYVILFLTTGLIFGDESGIEQTQKKVPVFRKGRNPVLQSGSTPVSIAIPPVISSDLSHEVLQNLLISVTTHIMEDENATVIDEEIINDISLKMQEGVGQICQDFACALEIGRWAKARMVLMVSAWKENKTWSLDLKLVDAVSGSIIKRQIDVFEGSEIDFLSVLVPRMVKAVVKIPERIKSVPFELPPELAREFKKETRPEQGLKKPELKSSRRWLWYTGGTALAAGATAVYFFLNPVTEGSRTIEMSRKVTLD